MSENIKRKRSFAWGEFGLGAALGGLVPLAGELLFFGPRIKEAHKQGYKEGWNRGYETGYEQRDRELTPRIERLEEQLYLKTREIAELREWQIEFAKDLGRVEGKVDILIAWVQQFGNLVGNLIMLLAEKKVIEEPRLKELVEKLEELMEAKITEILTQIKQKITEAKAKTQKSLPYLS
jgi:predicted transposase YdaD